jgi:ankyrin repeat protein
MSYSTPEERLLFELVDGVETGSVQRVGAALDAGADIRMRLSTGETALTKAARHDSLEIVRIVLDAARDVVHDRSWFDTALVAAASRRPMSLGQPLVEMILAAGADPKAMGRHTTALQGAVYAHNVDTARLLVEAGADVDAVIKGWNLTPLAIAIGMGGRLYPADLCENSLELVELLARAGANAAHVPAGGGWASPEQSMLTPYQYAMSIARFDIVTSLTHLAGQDPRQVAADGRSMVELLRTTSRSRREAASDFLLSLATEVDVRRSMGESVETARPARTPAPSL